MTTRGIFSSVAAAVLAAAIPAMTLAQTTNAAQGAITGVGKKGKEHRNFAEPLKVSNCNPERKGTMVTSGYTAGYYPVGIGPYWGWPSVYGPTYYQRQYVSANPTLAIEYANNTDIVMKQIEFGLVVRGELLAEVKDVGTFSPGAEIKHEFGVNNNVFPLPHGIPECIPLKITFADGTTWHNPHLPALRRQLYGHRP